MIVCANKDSTDMELANAVIAILICSTSAIRLDIDFLSWRGRFCQVADVHAYTVGVGNEFGPDNALTDASRVLVSVGQPPHADGLSAGSDLIRLAARAGLAE